MVAALSDSMSFTAVRCSACWLLPAAQRRKHPAGRLTALNRAQADLLRRLLAVRLLFFVLWPRAGSCCRDTNVRQA